MRLYDPAGAYLELQDVSGLNDELPRGQDVVRVVLVLVGPVQVEGRVPTEAGGTHSVGVEAPALLVRHALCGPKGDTHQHCPYDIFHP